jgi:hypothetical protein
LTEYKLEELEANSISWNAEQDKYVQNDLKVGDSVTRITRPSSSYSQLKKGAVTTVTEIYNYVTTTHYIRTYNSVRKNWDYHYIYQPRVRVAGSKQIYNADNFLKTGGNNMLALDVDRPTFVREFTENTVDGKVVRSYIGDLISFDNLSAAQVYCSNEISNSIRKDNTYRKFSIIVEKAVAQAKKPEIEFA